MSKDLLNPAKALIFRIAHRANLSDLLTNGCRCRSDTTGQGYTEIGNQELIERRVSRVVECPPGGTLADYVPFYFTPYSPMLYNIKTGYGGVQKRPMSDILILVTSLHTLLEMKHLFVFTDRHAYLKTAQFSADLSDLESRIIWPALQARNFKKDDVDRFEKYQAEALVHRHVPLNALKGIVCYDQTVKGAVQTEIDSKGLPMKAIARGEWYL